MGNKSFLAFLGAFFVLIFIILLLVINVATQVDDIEEQLKYATPSALETVPAVDSPTTGQTVYVPVYSHIYAQGGKPILLEATLSIRNTDQTRAITINSVKYFNTAGKLVEDYIEKPVSLAPLATTEVLVTQQRTEGGSGANFLVEWVSNKEVNPPLIETVMVGATGQMHISFARNGISIDAP